MYEIFEHTADVGLRVRAGTVSELFAEAARGLFSLIVANLDDVRCVESRRLHVEGNETDFLLFDWLNELLYRFETERLVLVEFDVQVGEGGLTAEARGERLAPERHRLDHEVKAVTYHGLRCEPDGDEWLAEVILDI